MTKPKKYLIKEVFDEETAELKPQKVLNPEWEKYENEKKKLPQENYVSSYNNNAKFIADLDPVACAIIWLHIQCCIVTNEGRIGKSFDKIFKEAGYGATQGELARAKLAKCGVIIKYENNWYINPTIIWKGSCETRIKVNKMLGYPRVNYNMIDFRKEFRISKSKSIK